MARWTEELDSRYVVADRSYGVAVYRREDGERMGGYRSLEEAAEDLADDPPPQGGGPTLRPEDRGEE